MQSFEVPVEEIISRRVVHTVTARDAEHASAIVRSLLKDGKDHDGPVREETLRKVVCAPNYAAAADIAPAALRPVETIAGLSRSELMAIPGPIVIGNLEIHTQTPLVYWRGGVIKLSMNLYRILLELAINVDKAVSRFDLLAAMNSDNEEYEDRTCDSNIKILRRAFRQHDANFNPVRSVSSVGYRLDSTAFGVAPRQRDLAAARLYIDITSREAFLDGKSLVLARGTFELLTALAKHPGMIFDDDAILRYGCPMTRSLAQSPSSARTAIKKIRNAVQDVCGHRDIVMTHYGLGVSLHPVIGKPVIIEEFA